VRVPEGRADELRVSELERRAGRLLDEDCAGLRSRECAAGRLKCGRAAVDLPVGAGLCVAAILGTCTSGAFSGAVGIGAVAWTAGSTW
jgi:hypothetical protein